MTQKQKQSMKGSLLAALDVGSSKIACFIARANDDGGGFDILGVGHHASAGIKNGAITDLDAAETAIRQTVHAAENMAADIMKGYPLREVVVSLSGVHARSHARHVDVRIHGHEITDSDVRRGLSKAQEQVPDTGQELVHTIPVGFQIDGHGGVRQPRGMYGQKMGIDIHMVSADESALRNLAACIERSHLDIAALCVSSYAAGLAVLVEDEMNLGCTVIDMGGGVTSFAVFQEGSLVYADAIPLGGRHVTNDIATGLTTSIADAERLKVLYGSAMASQADDSEMIDVPRLGEDRPQEPHHAPRSLLVGIIQPRVEEIFEMVRARLEDSGLGAGPGRRVVLTGGASQMLGMRELAQHVLDKQVRLGRPIRLGGVPDAASGPAFAATAGLIHYIAQHHDQIPAEVVTLAEPDSLWERVKLWLRENW